jgi:UDP-N-acetylglucosamine diphosphorylase/glucosamine-1-phosphate N-acetyltransferase
MTSYILCDTDSRHLLFPFTLMRPAADCRAGILTIREKWEYLLHQATSTLTENYLSEKFPIEEKEDNFFIDGALIPNEDLLDALHHLKREESLFSGNTWLASRCDSAESFSKSSRFEKIHYGQPFTLIRYPWDITRLNDLLLRNDFLLITKDRISQRPNASVKIFSPENVFAEEGAVLHDVTINASTGPVYIGKDALIMEGTLIRGPLAIGEKAVLKMGTKIYGATTIGHHSVAGGEIKNSVIFGFSNKAHDGYLGDAIIAEWCNLGAGTSCSNMKNNAGQVKVWNENEQRFLEAGQKCGLIMGDYSRSGINTMINTGTVTGVSCNIFNAGFPPKYIPSFSWISSGKNRKVCVGKGHS